jgi:ABC-type transport system substrate-binding protein
VAVFEQPKGDWDMFASGALFKPSPTDWYLIIAPNAPLAPGFVSPQMGALLQEGATISDQAKREAIYRQVQQRVWTDVPILPIGLLYGLDAAASSLQGYHPYFTPRFWNVY